MSDRFWLTPPDVMDRLRAEFPFDFDPCPCPRPDGYNSLNLPWGQCNYVNPPFRRKDGAMGVGPTAFVRKAIREHAAGKTCVLLLPTQSYVNMLLEAGAEARSMGRVRWLEADTKRPCNGPSPITAFILSAKSATQRRP
jgi:hypothetical protein